jgi:disulfide bond formation protein DsbB
MKTKSFILENGLHLSFAVALVATLGSLYLSDVMHFTPCKLCWYQRILMYPMVLLLGIAAVRKDYKISTYVLPLSIIGGCISTYHYLIQKTSLFKAASNACGDVPCDMDYLDWYGFITIPLLAFIAFVMIAVIHSLIRKAIRS